MGQQIIGLLNPLLAMMFCIFFFCFWLAQRNKPHILAIAIAYFTFACGIFVSNVGISAQALLHVISTHFFYSIAVTLVVWAVCKRSNQATNTVFNISLALAATPILIWLHSNSGNANFRVIFANAIYCVILLMGAKSLWHSRQNHKLDYWLFVLFIFMGLQFLVRPVAVFAFEGEVSNTEYRSSIYYSILNVSVSLLSLALAFSLLAMCAVDYLNEMAGNAKKSKKSKSDADTNTNVSRLMTIMETNIHRQHDLSINALAQASGIQEHHLRAIINQSLGHKNFREFLNSHRLKEVQSALSDPDRLHDSITTIAFDSGFNSIPSFNRVFKSQFGMAPSEYRDRMVANWPTDTHD